MAELGQAVVSEAFSGSGNSNNIITQSLGTTALAVDAGQTVYTYTATGTVGQTATVLGSNDGTNWVTIGTLTVATDTASGQNIDAYSAIHAFKYIKKSGVAVVSVSRG